MKMSSEKLPAKVNPKNTPRAAAFELWMNAPNPMVTFFKTLDVTPLVRMSKKRNEIQHAALLVYRKGRKRD